MNKNKKKNVVSNILVVLIACILIVFAYNTGKKVGANSINNKEEDTSEKTATISSPNSAYEYLGSGLAWQLSAESQALMMQAYSIAEKYVDEMIALCDDMNNTEWTIEYDANGNKQMYHNGVRVAIVSDIDDTLVDGAYYTADIVGNDGDYNNAAFARFIMSDACKALPGAVDFVKKCVDNGIDFYYVTNRYDQAYKIGQSDSISSYEQSISKEGKGLYCKDDGSEIGSSLYQTYGKTIYDISYKSMEKLGFPVDDQHLIVNDNKLKGSSKQAARNAIQNGDIAYPNGQLSEGNALNCATTINLEKHEIVMLLGDNIGDFTDDFSSESLDAISRSTLATNQDYKEEWGVKWIVLPNAMYGNSISYATSYGLNNLFKYYAYTN